MDRPWDRQVGERTEWYLRFLTFLKLGPSRSVERAYRVWVGREDVPVDPAWEEMARIWRWEERARAWDEAGGDLAEVDLDEGISQTLVTQARKLVALIQQEIGRLLERASWGPLSDEEIERMARLVRLLAATRDIAAPRF
ncbi:MAG: hypothetical protein RML46_06690 [Anaerolineae bacterium]|nr:hypothetical protein [Anaerolineae bacterium]